MECFAKTKANEIGFPCCQRKSKVHPSMSKLISNQFGSAHGMLFFNSETAIFIKFLVQNHLYRRCVFLQKVFTHWDRPGPGFFRARNGSKKILRSHDRSAM